MRKALLLIVGMALLAGTTACAFSFEPVGTRIAGAEAHLDPCEGRRDAPVTAVPGPDAGTLRLTGSGPELPPSCHSPVPASRAIPVLFSPHRIPLRV